MSCSFLLNLKRAPGECNGSRVAGVKLSGGVQEEREREGQ